MVKFTIKQDPTGQERPRFSRKTGHAYKSSNQTTNQNALMAEMLPYRPDKPLKGALTIHIKVALAIPASSPKWWFHARDTVGMKPIKRPDIDNIIKQILDCMKVLKFFKDDSQVVMLTAIKIYWPTSFIAVELYEEWQPKTKTEYDRWLLDHRMGEK